MCPKLLPNIELGAMVKPATAAAPDFKKVRLEMFAIIVVVFVIVNNKCITFSLLLL